MAAPETNNESNLIPVSGQSSEIVDFDDVYENPVISRLLMSQRPKPSTICRCCLTVIWSVLPKEVQCYRRTIYAVIYSNEEKDTLTACDGQDIAIEQLLAKQVEADTQEQAAGPPTLKRKATSRR